MKVIEKPTRFRKTLEELEGDLQSGVAADPWGIALASLQPARPDNSITIDEFCQKFNCARNCASVKLNALVTAGKADVMVFPNATGHRIKVWVLK